jgi:hypothetical protein
MKSGMQQRPRRRAHAPVPARRFVIHLDMWPGLGDSTYYEAVGVTDSGALDRNL